MAKSKTETKVLVAKTGNRIAIIKPRVTEKAVLKQEKSGVYTFNVEKEATKRDVLLEVKSKYKVTPLKINMVTIPKKNKFFRGAWGKKGGGKKALVYLKKGDKINIA